MSEIEQSIKRKIEAVGTPLGEWDISINYGIKTGRNEAFIIDGATKNRLIAEDPKSAEIIRPILRGRDIKRYAYKFADQYVILASFGSHEWLEERYPAIYAHLVQYEDKLRARGQVRYTSSGKPNTHASYPGQHHWLELDNNPRQTYLDDFSKQKIVYREISAEMNACLIEEDIFINNKGYILTGENLIYLLLIFNSKIFNSLLLRQANATGGKGPSFLKTIRIPRPDDAQACEAQMLFERISSDGADSDAAEEEVEQYVSRLFALSPEELNSLL